MSYAQITNRCNMECDHCGFNCTAEGQDMTMEIFEATLQYFKEEVGMTMAIGGGEPTLHPLFMDFLWKAIIANAEYGEDFPVWLATNGSNTELSLTLAALARRGVISCALSQDEYHDCIDYDVIEAFTVNPNIRYANDYREIRTATNIKNVGRAIDTGVGTDDDGCACPGTFVAPDGSIKPCGCLDAPIIGNVLSEPRVHSDISMILDEVGLNGECWSYIQEALNEDDLEKIESILNDRQLAA